MGERVSHECNPPPLKGFGLRFQRSSGRLRASSSRLNIFDNEIEANRCPMTLVGASRLDLRARDSAALLASRKMREDAPTISTDGERIEAPADLEPECARVELDRAFEVIGIDIGKQLHRLI
jgi:hypothetical protein